MLTPQSSVLTLLGERCSQNRAAFGMAVLCGLGAALLVVVYLEGDRRQLLEWATPVTVVVAAADLREMSRIDETMVRLGRVPRKFVQPGALPSVEAVVGRVAVAPILAGEQLLGTKVTTAAEAPLAVAVPRGMRALTVAVSDVTGVAGLIRPGNSVDVLSTVEKGDDRTSEAFTMTLLQNILVLAIEHRLGAQPRPAPPADGERSLAARVAPTVSSHERVRNVTLALSPHDAQRVTLAQEIGVLTLTLRSRFEGREPVTLERLTHEALLGIKKPLPRRRLPAWRELRSLEQLDPGGP